MAVNDKRQAWRQTKDDDIKIESISGSPSKRKKDYITYILYFLFLLYRGKEEIHSEIVLIVY